MSDTPEHVWIETDASEGWADYCIKAGVFTEHPGSRIVHEFVRFTRTDLVEAQIAAARREALEAAASIIERHDEAFVSADASRILVPRRHQHETGMAYVAAIRALIEGANND